MKRLVLTIAILIGLAAPAWAGYANQGDARAQYTLGLMYEKGWGEWYIPLGIGKMGQP